MKNKAALIASFDEFTTGYFEAALFTEDPEPGSGEYAADLLRISRSSLISGAADCAEFQRNFGRNLAEFARITGRPADYAGHDFWLTRNGHGAGFWDRGAGDTGDRLTKAAEWAGEVHSEWWRGVLWIHTPERGNQ